jgi:hypothetical protein
MTPSFFSEQAMLYGVPGRGYYTMSDCWESNP